jgi:hypothetical protein
MNLFVGNNPTNSYFASSEAVAYVNLRQSGIIVYDGSTALSIDNDMNNLNLNEVWNLVIDMDIATKTWTLTVNDIVMSDSVVGSTFGFRNDITTINAIGLDGAIDASQVFFDDVQLEAIPEPATMGLLSFATLGLLLVRRLRM